MISTWAPTEVTWPVEEYPLFSSKTFWRCFISGVPVSPSNLTEAVLPRLRAVLRGARGLARVGMGRRSVRNAGASGLASCGLAAGGPVPGRQAEPPGHVINRLVGDADGARETPDAAVSGPHFPHKGFALGFRHTPPFAFAGLALWLFGNLKPADRLRTRACRSAQDDRWL